MKKATRLALINALIAGGIAFFSGSLSTGQFEWRVIGISFCTFMLVFLLKLREYFSNSTNKKAIKGRWFEFI